MYTNTFEAFVPAPQSSFSSRPKSTSSSIRLSNILGTVLETLSPGMWTLSVAFARGKLIPRTRCKAIKWMQSRRRHFFSMPIWYWRGKKNYTTESLQILHNLISFTGSHDSETAEWSRRTRRYEYQIHSFESLLKLHHPGLCCLSLIPINANNDLKQMTSALI